jgi:hypothetical protein
MVKHPAQWILTIMLIMLWGPLWAATITVKTDRDPVALNENFRIIFKAEGSLDGEPDFSPLNQDFQLLGTGQSSQFSMVNGNVSSSKTYTLTVAPLRQGKITIPAISFGRDKSPESSVSVVAAGSQQPKAVPSAPMAAKDMMFIRSEVDTHTPYVQQQVILRVKVFRNRRWSKASLSEPQLQGVEARVQPLGQATSYDTSIGNKTYQVTEMAYALFPQQSGELDIAPFQVTARFPAGVKQQRSPLGGLSNDPFFDSFFSRQTYDTRSAQSKALSIKVKPIPASFTGKHWLPARDIQLQQTWSDDIGQLQTGEPVTRTLAIIGDGVGIGQLPEIAMATSSELKSYPDQPLADERVSSQGLLSTVTQKFALIPSQPGDHEIPAIEIPWWNTETDKMQTAQLPAARLKVTGTAIATPATQAPAPVLPAPTQDKEPVANNLADTVASDSSTEPTRTILLIAVVVLTILWLLTLLALFMKRKTSGTRPAANNQANHQQASFKSAQRQLEKACKQQRPDEVRDALITWARAAWPQDPPNNLDDIATRLPDEAAQQLARLSAMLYGQGDQDWDANSIWQSVRHLPMSGHHKQVNKEESLEPLYR